jgi:hypothetical protein
MVTLPTPSQEVKVGSGSGTVGLGSGWNCSAFGKGVLLPEGENCAESPGLRELDIVQLRSVV